MVSLYRLRPDHWPEISDVAYGELLRVADQMANPSLDPFRVKLVPTSNPFAQAALEIHRRFPGAWRPAWGAPGSAASGLMECTSTRIRSPRPLRESIRGTHGDAHRTPRHGRGEGRHTGPGPTAGEVGAVVEVLGDGDAFEVEFCDNSGQTYGLHTLRASQIIGLHHRGQALRAACRPPPDSAPPATASRGRPPSWSGLAGRVSLVRRRPVNPHKGYMHHVRLLPLPALVQATVLNPASRNVRAPIVGESRCASTASSRPRPATTSSNGRRSSIS